MIDNITRVQSRIQEIKSQIKKVHTVAKFDMNQNIEKVDTKEQKIEKESEKLEISQKIDENALKDEILKKFNLSGLKVDDIKKNKTLDFYKIMQNNLFD